MPQVLSQIRDYFLTNLWWIIALAVLLVFALSFLLYFLIRKRKGKKAKKPSFSKSDYVLALGGEENILSHELRGSRIVLRLKDYKAINEEKIKEAGVTGFIEMKDRLTLVVKDHAEKVYRTIFGE